MFNVVREPGEVVVVAEELREARHALNVDRKVNETPAAEVKALPLQGVLHESEVLQDPLCTTGPLSVVCPRGEAPPPTSSPVDTYRCP